MSESIRPFAQPGRNIPVPGDGTLRVLTLAMVYAAAILLAVAFSPATGHAPHPGARTASLSMAYSPR